MEDIAPLDDKVHLSKIKVTAVEGPNYLIFEGAGASDGYGLTIDDVMLVDTVESCAKE